MYFYSSRIFVKNFAEIFSGELSGTILMMWWRVIMPNGYPFPGENGLGDYRQWIRLLSDEKHVDCDKYKSRIKKHHSYF
jgi:hypothetical protein